MLTALFITASWADHSEVEGSRGISFWDHDRIESLPSPPAAAALQPRVRVGMTVISCFRAQNYLHGYWQVIGPPIRHASRGVTLKAGSHPDASDTCVVRALDVDLTVAD
jgi:hypothetical protein